MKYEALPKSSERFSGRGKPMGGAKVREGMIMNKYEASIEQQIEVKGVHFFLFREGMSLMKFRSGLCFFGFLSNSGIELNSMKYMTGDDGRQMKTLGKQLLFSESLL